MAIFNFQILLLYSSLSIFFCFLFPQSHSLSFNLTNIGPQHQNVNITTLGDANITSQGLQLTPNGENMDLKYRAGKAQWATSLHLWDNSTGSLTDFDTHFVFVIDSGGSSSFSDGLTFFLADPIESDITPAYAMGLPVNRDTFMGSFVAVEFDTFQNTEDWGPWGSWDPVNISPVTHVGIDVNSLESKVTAPWYCNVPDGIENEAWIRYESRSHNLSVVFTGSTNTTRFNDTIHLIVDLRNYLPEWVTFGFSAATGGAAEKHTVISWEFSSSFQIVDPGPKKLPFGALVGTVLISVVLVGGFGWVGFVLCKRSRENGKIKSEVELPMQNEDEDGPMLKDTRFGELPRAPKLKDRRFGVYRNFLRELNSYFAVELRHATNEDAPMLEDRRLPRPTNEDGPKLKDRRSGGVFGGFLGELESFIAT